MVSAQALQRLALPAIYKWILIAAMLIGRIEILTIYKAIQRHLRTTKNPTLKLNPRKGTANKLALELLWR